MISPQKIVVYFIVIEKENLKKNRNVMLIA